MPEAIATLTAIPAVATGLPLTSCNWTTGACVKAAPLMALAGGWVTMPSRPAPPATAVAVKVTGSPVIPAGAASAVTGVTVPCCTQLIEVVTITRISAVSARHLTSFICPHLQFGLIIVLHADKRYLTICLSEKNDIDYGMQNK